MRLELRYRTIVGWLGLAAALIVAAAGRADPSSAWYEDASGYQEAVRQQKILHAPMLVYFRTDWCPHCRAFDKLLEDSQVRSQIGPYVKVRINPEHGKREKEIFEEQFGAIGFPALFFQDSEMATPARISAKGPADRFVAQFAR
ncbi:MAG TPA: thioredoxin fold domain-containing protein [Candidatus Binatia bacterium]|nr:thioredoxin fold domain-containing protein [Candidatus Binatia bacterium]